MVEFALVLPFLLLLTLVTIDFGRVYLGYINLQNMARIAANYASINPTAWSGTGDAAVQATYASQIRNDARATNCTLPATIPPPQFPTGTSVGQTAKVELTCTFGVITPIMSNIVGGSVAVGASAVFPIRAGIIATGGGALPPLPVAAFSGLPTSGPASLSVHFTDESTGIRTSWSWSFGDGGSSTDQSPVHLYDTPGTYSVSQTVTNATGSDTATKASYIVVTVATGQVAFSGIPLAGAAPLAVQFTDESTGVGGIAPTAWHWSFGDGGSSTARNPSHTYASRGTYAVTLAITAPWTGSLTKDAYVVANLCKVPDFSGVKRNKAQESWDAAGFTTTVTDKAGAPNGNGWTIGAQSLTGLSDVACTSVIAVSDQ